MATLKVKDVSKRFGVAVPTVLRWIEAKELRAVDVSKSRYRPIWRISEEALKAFEESRSSCASAK